MKNKLNRNIIPPVSKPKDIKFPEYRKLIIHGEGSAYVITDRRFPVVTFRIIFKTGSIFDRLKDNKSDGLSNFMFEMLTKGTNKRTASEISHIIDSFGASITTGSDYDYNYITFHCLKKYFGSMMELVSDIISSPAFSDDEIERMQLQKINYIYSLMDSGDYLASKLYKKMLYGDSQYSVNIEGTLDSIPGINKEKLNYAYENFLLDSHTALCFIGDIDEEEVFRIIENGSFKKGKEKTGEIKINPQPEINKTKVYIVERKSAVQSDIIAGGRAIMRNHPDFIPLKMMNTVLGGSFTSRINTNLREVNGYTYGAKSLLNTKKYQGDIFVETNVKNDLTGEALKEIINEMKRMQDEPVGEEELESVKNYITGTYPMQLETPNSIASKVLGLDLFDIDAQFYNTYISKINEVTPQSIQQAARKYLMPDKLVISVCGNPDDIKASLRKSMPDVEIIEQQKF